MREEQIVALKTYIDAVVAERIQDAFGRDSGHETVARLDAEQVLDRVLADFEDNNTNKPSERSGAFTLREIPPPPQDLPEPPKKWEGVYPGMCVDPEACRGKTHCPRSYSCCE